MTAPTSLDEWTIDSLKELTAIGRGETDTYDFKTALPETDLLTKAACSFANSKGGFLVLGVKERSGHFLLEGMPPDAEVSKRFADRIQADPAIQFNTPLLLHVPGTDRVIYVFHVPRSLDRPHLPTDKGRRVFWKRTHSGAEQMTLEEIRMLFRDNEERRDKLTLLLLELITARETLQSLGAYTGDGILAASLDTTVIDRVLVEAYSVIQQDAKLLGLIVALRVQLRQLNDLIHLAYAKFATAGFQGLDRVVSEQYKVNMQRSTPQLITMVDQAVEALVGRLGVRNPLEPPTSSSGAAPTA